MFYERDSDDVFLPTEHTRGPWSLEHQHGGPPCALLARSGERTGFRITRCTFDFLRPVPIVPLRVRTELERDGRSVQVVRAELVDVDADRVVLRGRIQRTVQRELALEPTPSQAPAVPPEEALRWEFPFFADRPGYHRAMDVRIAKGEFGKGAVQAWMSMRIPLVGDEEPSAVVRAVTASDSGNGVSPVLDYRRWTFINPDLTVILHREPVGVWVCLDARSDVHPDGIGAVRTVLRDADGAFGQAAQTLVIRPRS